MIEDIFLPQKLKWQRDEKDQIGRIAAVNSVETVRVEYVASEPQFMTQGARVFVDITERRCAFRGKRVAIDVDAFDDFVTGFVAFGLRTYNGNERASAGQRQRFLPDAAIERNWQVLDDDEDPLSA